jgi:DNA-binding transcriptional regulator YiaG
MRFWTVRVTKLTVPTRFLSLGFPCYTVGGASRQLLLARQPARDRCWQRHFHCSRRASTGCMCVARKAGQLGVDKTSIYNWEGNRSKPDLTYMPAIIRFLGYNPLPPSDAWSDRLVQCRTALGLSQKESAQRIGVDPCTLARWERGERDPTGAFAARALRFLTVAATRTA